MIWVLLIILNSFSAFIHIKSVWFLKHYTFYHYLPFLDYCYLNVFFQLIKDFKFLSFLIFKDFLLWSFCSHFINEILKILMTRFRYSVHEWYFNNPLLFTKVYFSLYWQFPKHFQPNSYFFSKPHSNSYSFQTQVPNIYSPCPHLPLWLLDFALWVGSKFPPTSSLRL